MSTQLNSIQQAIDDFRQGNMVILVDDEDRENEGDLCIPAEHITPEAINFMATHARGLICLALEESIVDRLQLPMMVEKNTSPYGTAFTISIEAAKGVSTGISAADRACTIKTAVNPSVQPGDLTMPGHVFPLRARNGGVLIRPGQTEGSTDLARMAGCQGAAVICEIINDDGGMARLPDLQRFSAKHNIPIVSINDLIAYRMQSECLVQEIAQSALPTPFGQFTVRVFSNKVDSYQHVVMQAGDLDIKKPILVRVHSECLTGDVFQSKRCDCGWQLNTAMTKIAKEGGVLLYLQGHEGRGIGLANKLKAYALQEQGLDTVEANHQLGFAADQREYGIAAQILRYIGIRQMTLLTNNPLKIHSLKGYGIDVVNRQALQMPATAENQFYLQTKKNKLGHLLAVE